MEPAAIAPERAGDPGDRHLRAEGGTRATVFGLDVRSASPLLLLRGSQARPTGRALTVATDTGEEAAHVDWPTSAELLCEERQPDGSAIFRIEAHHEAGYLISGPGYGAFRVSADGAHLRCDPGGRPDAVWQRLLIAQILPFAALLQGLEVFHASAVVREGRAVAFLGSSGAGKTSLALELCRRGARFLADDVLALEASAPWLLAHPGTPIAGVAHAQARARREAESSSTPGETVATNSRERLVRMVGPSEPVPLGAMFFVDRRADGPEQPRFEVVADAPPLLAATFNFVLATPTRLRGLLDACALAARLRVERIAVGPATGVRELGAAVERRLSLPA